MYRPRPLGTCHAKSPPRTKKMYRFPPSAMRFPEQIFLARNFATHVGRMPTRMNSCTSLPNESSNVVVKHWCGPKPLPFPACSHAHAFVDYDILCKDPHMALYELLLRASNPCSHHFAHPRACEGAPRY